jgi:23S rRNA U2552 (ribose-2'-O)-methylase RlmE/FtsJ
MLIKMFQHADSDRFVVALRKHFERINRRKPAASRQASREFYVVAAGFRG